MSTLKAYKCHKVVHAEPMTLGEWRLYRYGEGNTAFTEIDNSDEEGYHVVYSKGTAREHESWSPKDVFDEGYDDIDGYLTDKEHAKVHINIVQHELNENLKRVEAELMSRLADVFDNTSIDGRCLALARTNFEQGFMWANRAFHQALIDQIEGRRK